MLTRKGREEGLIIGEQRGKIEAVQEMVIELAGEQYGPLSISLKSEIRSILPRYVTTLKNLWRQILKLDNIEDFTGLVKKALEK